MTTPDRRAKLEIYRFNKKFMKLQNIKNLININLKHSIVFDSLKR